MFSENHGSKNLPPKCQEMKKIMEDMKEATMRGESVYNEQSLDDIREKEIQLFEWNN
ncbi:hypothetical protein MKW92_022298 [Papaver armeniacum]|nr:hypothetical protein MKW92_022298 [Papaver armeniacum]